MTDTNSGDLAQNFLQKAKSGPTNNLPIQIFPTVLTC